MKMLEPIICYIITITFPVLLYTIFVEYKEKFSNDKRKMMKEASLFVSFALTLYFSSSLNDPKYGIVTVIPLIISFDKKHSWLAIVMSIILLSFHINVLNIPIIPATLLLASYYAIYDYCSKRTKSIYYFLLSIFISTVISLAVYFAMNYNFFSLQVYKEFALLILYFSIILFISLEIISKAKNVMNTYMTLEYLEKDKEIKTNLFKITHEIKNPIAVIKGYLEMFEIEDVEKSKKYLKIMEQEVHNSLNILSDFSDFTKIKNISKEEMSINTLLEELKESVAPFFNSKNIYYYFKVEDDIKIFGDYKRLKQVLVNLIKNAVEASDNYTEISLTSFKSNDKLYIFIKDNGKGMNKETLDNIFTPFYTNKNNGTGLGLALSKEIIEAHKGSIEYTSIISKGTTVKIILPTC